MRQDAPPYSCPADGCPLYGGAGGRFAAFGCACAERGAYSGYAPQEYGDSGQPRSARQYTLARNFAHATAQRSAFAAKQHRDSACDTCADSSGTPKHHRP